MTAPLVSIIIPAYRASRYIGETFTSIRAQTHPQWEVLVFEDGIFDDTAAQVEKFSATTTNSVRLQQSQTNLGVSRARNALLDAARGEYIAFLDADDTWTSRYLENAIKRLELAGADWMIGGARLIDGNGQSLKREIIPPVVSAAAIPTELLKHSFILPSAVVAHRRVFETGLRFESSFPIGEDLDLWIRVVGAGFKPVIVPEPLIDYRKHPASATADPVRFPEEFSRLFERYLGNPIVDQQLCRAGLGSMLTSVARMSWRRDPERALRALRRLFRVTPWHVPAWPFFVMAKAAQLTSS
jgi:glycosyltransferase involved in cell wall biosynthesis